MSRFRTSNLLDDIFRFMFVCGMFDTETLNGLKGEANSWLLLLIVFPLLFRVEGNAVVANAICKHFCFSHLGLAHC